MTFAIGSCYGRTLLHIKICIIGFALRICHRGFGIFSTLSTELGLAICGGRGRGFFDDGDSNFGEVRFTVVRSIVVGECSSSYWRSILGGNRL